MQTCVKAAASLLEYASTSYPNQFDYYNNRGLVPIGLSKTARDPIYYIGLKPAASFVTPDVEKARIELAHMLDEADYYYDKTQQLTKGYPIDWDQNSALYQKVSALANKAEANHNLLINKNDPNEGALGCWNTPDRCMELYNKIVSRITHFTAADLAFTEDFHFTYSTCEGNLHRTGDGWGLDAKGQTETTKVAKIDSGNINFDVVEKDGTEAIGTLKSNDGGNNFSGTVDRAKAGKHTKVNCTAKKDTSSFYFTQWKPKVQELI